MPVSPCEERRAVATDRWRQRKEMRVRCPWENGPWGTHRLNESQKPALTQHASYKRLRLMDSSRRLGVLSASSGGRKQLPWRPRGTKISFNGPKRLYWSQEVMTQIVGFDVYTIFGGQMLGLWIQSPACGLGLGNIWWTTWWNTCKNIMQRNIIHQKQRRKRRIRWNFLCWMTLYEVLSMNSSSLAAYCTAKSAKLAVPHLYKQVLLLKHLENAAAVTFNADIWCLLRDY